MKVILWFTLVFACALGITWQYFPLENASARIRPVLAKLGGEELPKIGWEASFFKDVDLYKRLFQNGDTTICIFIIDATRNRHVVHDPLFCYQGSGWKVTGSQEWPLPKGKGMIVSLERDGVTKKFGYWFSDGKECYNSFFRYWLTCSLRRMTLGLTGAEPVLITIDVSGNAPCNWQAILAEHPALLEL
jgi:hypothetical protein